MALVAICPNCDFEFMAPGDAVGGDFADCPACAATFELRDDLEMIDEPKASAKTVAIEPSSAELDPTERRIEKWFRSAETIADVPAEAAEDILDRPIEEPLDAPAEMTAEVAAPDDDIELANFDDELAAAKTIDEIELDSPDEQPERGATWDDAEQMDLLLADIDAGPVEENLPVTIELEPPHDPDAATLEYSLDEREAIEREKPDWKEAASTKAGAAAAVADDLAISPSERPRRRRSGVRMLVGSMLAGVIGLAAGYMALIWWLGPAGDVLNLAHYLPSAILPSSLRGAPAAEGSRQPAPFVAQGEPASLPAADIGNTSETLPEPVVPAAQQANFETPATLPNNISSAPTEARSTHTLVPQSPNSGNADELARFDRTVPMSTPPAAAPPSIRDAPSYSPDQLAAALRAAREAQPGLIEGSLDDKEVQRTKGLSFSKFAELAEIATFVNANPQAAGGEPSSAEVDALFRETLADRRIRDEVARIVPIWMTSAHRRHGGILFTGGIGDRVNYGNFTEIQLHTPPSGSPLIVLAPKQVSEQIGAMTVGRSYAVVGSLIDRPAERIEGYTGTAAQAVWANRLIPLD